ncbi:transglutaminase-like domain-containing protein [Paenibacillus hodogayensis]|uniref:Transglutaminase-like domain-containing protein n=1 Tax=Paenibacillus hodogayensis TaxID=279208 RepID=A0ABV5VQY4_9BACL
MRKLVLLAMALFLLAPALVATKAQAAEIGVWLDTNLLAQGAVTVRYDVKPQVKTKLTIAKGTDKYTYTLKAGVPAETFPLQMGNGDYTVTVLEQISGTKYQVVGETVVKLALTDNANVYLNSVQNVNWSEARETVRIAKELIKNATTDGEKVQALYQYVIDNVKYDAELAANVPAEYIPQIDRTLLTKTDICYGYAALFAGMLRSTGIPAKLVMGTTEYVTAYHAWNEVYLNGSWVIIDTTVDAGLNGSATAFAMIKDAAKYTAAKVY